MVFAFNAFLISRTFKKEFMAKYKANKSSKEFRKFLDSLPEGVSIIDEEASQFKFINQKLKQTFDIKSFFKPSENSDILDEIKQTIDEEFDELLDKLSTDSLEKKEYEI